MGNFAEYEVKNVFEKETSRASPAAQALCGNRRRKALHSPPRAHRTW
jgi:hypothetical protein